MFIFRRKISSRTFHQVSKWNQSLGYVTWQARISEQLKHRHIISVNLWRQQTGSAVCGTNAVVCVLCTITLICFHTGVAAPSDPPRETKSTTTAATPSRALAVCVVNGVFSPVQLVCSVSCGGGVSSAAPQRFLVILLLTSWKKNTLFWSYLDTLTSRCFLRFQHVAGRRVKAQVPWSFSSKSPRHCECVCFSTY